MLDKRKYLFKKELVTKVYLAYPEKPKESEFNQFLQWPSTFDFESVPPISEAVLKLTPKHKKGESVAAYLNKFEIKV
jgi:hypothetical protein